MTEEERRRYEPAAYFGSLPDLDEEERAGADRRAGGDRGDDDGTAERRGHDGRRPLRIYASFGTVVWRYYTEQALAALEAVAAYGASAPCVEVTIGLGSGDAGASARRRLERYGAVVHERADQWRILQGTDLFVTHHGLRSTHEAVYRRVPMLSYPFLADQPFMARRCEEMELAVPLAREPRAPIGPEDVAAAVDAVERRRASMLAAIEAARAAEIETFHARESVLRRIAALAVGAAAGAVFA